MRFSRNRSWMAWNDLSQTMRDTFETTNNCCGFQKSARSNWLLRRANCKFSRMFKQTEWKTGKFVKWLAVAVFIFAILAFLNYLVAYQLIREYKACQREFKTRQSDKITTKYAKSIKSPVKWWRNNNEKCEKLMDQNFVFTVDFFKPTPKPVISRNESDIPRSNWNDAHIRRNCSKIS